MPDPYVIAMIGAGALIALVAWLPLALKRLPLSLPIVCMAIGAVLYSVPHGMPAPMPMAFPIITERLTEFVVIIALMGAGLKIDRVLSWGAWRVTWRLLAITMPLSIAAFLLVGAWAGLPWVAALLVAASLAPTDPVLASDVQVGPPRTGEEDEVRFGLTSEAGLNDSLAFPFVHLAIALSVSASSGEPWFGKWLAHNVVWEIVGGIAGGWLVGVAFGWLAFRMPTESKLSQTGDGLIAVAATFVSYGLTETIHCYGFLAVFVTALQLRHSHREHDFQREMHDITEQLERLAMMVVLLLFGGAIVGGLLTPLTWADYAFAALALFVVRPLAGLIGLAGSDTPLSERCTLAFFGIRGVGSFYYLAYGLNHAPFSMPERLWAIVGLIALASILMHGLMVTPIMRLLDQAHGRDPDNPTRPPQIDQVRLISSAER